MSDAIRTETVTSERKTIGGLEIALVTIDNPPVNAASQAMRRDLMQVMTDLSSHTDIAGIILTGANGAFIAGADIREFDKPQTDPILSVVVDVIEACPIPVVAAIDGAALGGGYEVTLGCDARVATPRSIVGLPEVSLGVFPAAGGTQRLPRLVDMAVAIDVIAGGKRLGAKEAAELGMIDRVAETDLVAEAAVMIAELGGEKRVLSKRDAIVADLSEVEKVEQEWLGKARGAEAIPVAIASVRQALDTPFAEAIRADRMTFARISAGSQARALRHLFFAERAAARPRQDAKAAEIREIAIVGGGRMGRAIAVAHAMAGYEVQICDIDVDKVVEAMTGVENIIFAMEKSGRIPSAQAVLDRIYGCGFGNLDTPDLIIEAIHEDMDAKKAIFRDMDLIAKPDAILVTNTSYLDIDEIAAETKRPERVAGLHFFNPAHVMKLVEVVRAEQTDPNVEATLMKLCRKLGKTPVVSRVGEGFIGNRIFSAYRKQAEFLLEEGALPEQVDEAMREFGMAMGPFAVFDLAGLEIGWATRQRLAHLRDKRERYVAIADRLCEAERFGKTSGKGWYDYSDDGKAKPDPKVTAMIEAASIEKGLDRRMIGADEIRNRLFAAIVNEAALVLAEGIAMRPGDIDLVLVNGYGFPRLTGGPIHWASNRPREDFLASVDDMVDAGGFGWTRAPNLEDVLSGISIGSAPVGKSVN